MPVFKIKMGILLKINGERDRAGGLAGAAGRSPRRCGLLGPQPEDHE
jgi:hypothetical protein